MHAVLSWYSQCGHLEWIFYHRYRGNFWWPPDLVPSTIDSWLRALLRSPGSQVWTWGPHSLWRIQELELKPRGWCVFSPVARIMNEQPLVIEKTQEYELKPRGWCWSSPVAREINVI